MHLEVPVCTRCCICIPLRYGLIVGGYLKLFIGCYTLLQVSMYAVLMFFSYEPDIMYKIMLCSWVTISFVDIPLNIMYIVGCHKKNLKIMKIYYFYSKILLTGMASYCLYFIFTVVYHMDSYRNIPVEYFLGYGISQTVVILADIVSQVYMTILVRSEIVKLESRSGCRFVNNAADAQCTLIINDNITQEDETSNYEKRLNIDDDSIINTSNLRSA